MRPSALRLSVVLMAVFAVIALGIPAMAAAEYDLSADDGVSVPERTVEIEEFNNEFEIDTFVSGHGGDTISIDVTVPGSASWTVQLINSDRVVVNSVSGSGSGSAELDAVDVDGDLEPGTYGLALIDRGSYEAVVPLVINGYDISLEYDTELDADSDLEVTAEVIQTDAQTDPDGIEFVAWDGDDVTMASLEHVGGTTYEKTISLEEGSYDVYAAAASGDEVEGFPVTNGVVSGPSISVGDADTGNGDDDGTSDDGNGAGGGDAPADLQSTWQTDLSTTATETGEPVTITLGLNNAGGEAASETITINANGEQINETDVRLVSDSGTLIDIDHVFTEPGEYEITAESETLGTVSVGTVSVTGDPIEDDDPSVADTESESVGTDDSTTDTPTNDSMDDMSDDEDTIPGFGIAVALISLIVFISAIHKYRGQSSSAS